MAVNNFSDFISRFSPISQSEKEDSPIVVEKNELSTGLLPKDLVVYGSIEAGCNINIMGQVVGNITSKGDIIISGNVKGDIVGENISFIDSQIEGKVIGNNGVNVAVNSIIYGDIQASNITVSGTINGNIFVDGHLQLAEKSVITGDIEAHGISIANGAIVNGRIKINK